MCRLKVRFHLYILEPKLATPCIVINCFMPGNFSEKCKIKLLNKKENNVKKEHNENKKRNFCVCFSLFICILDFLYYDRAVSSTLILFYNLNFLDKL